jgi:aminocarboxymuconate-semialdehyde decarboxylase
MDRRRFLRDLTGVMAGLLVAGGARDVLDAASQPAKATRRQVLIGGRRVKTVDVHSHCVFPGVMEMVGQTTPIPNPALVVGPERLDLMDAQGIDVEVLSINPFWYALAPEAAGIVIGAQNQQLAELCATHPDRFVGLATVALQHPDLAAAQLDTAVKTLGMRGASIAAHVNGDELSLPKFNHFGRRPRNSASSCSSIRSPFPSWRRA